LALFEVTYLGEKSFLCSLSTFNEVLV